jgi:3-oxoacyl-[acyl-carrier protein] reductase
MVADMNPIQKPDLSGDVALVTGAGRGIGKAIALALAAAGARVVLTARSKNELDHTLAEIESAGGQGLAVPADVSDPAAVAVLADQAESSVGPISVLVNNGGITSRGHSIVDTESEEVLRLLWIHAIGVHHLCRIVVPTMRTLERGDVIMISSQSAISRPPGGAPYSMAKAAMEALAVTLAKEERRHGIRVNIVAPGLVATEMGRRYVRAAFGAADIADVADASPFERMCSPEDVAGVVQFLISDAGAYITGARVPVDGGDWDDPDASPATSAMEAGR